MPKPSVPLPADPRVIETYEDLIAALVSLRSDRGLSQLAMDDKAGLPAGYTGKIEISARNSVARNARALGRDSLPLVLGALDARLVLMPAERLQEKVRIPLSERGRRGGKASLQTMTAEERSERARKAVQARWGNGRP